MTATARVVLKDCEIALAELRDLPRAELWRPRWAGLVALLRTSLHVLYYVDRVLGTPAMRAAIDSAWADVEATKPEPRILWEFIKAERDLLLKQYRTTAHQHVTVFLGPAVWRINAPPSEPDPPGPPQRPPEYRYEMGAGSFAGRHPRDVAQEALEWLRDYLGEIDRLAENASKQGL